MRSALIAPATGAFLLSLSRAILAVSATVLALLHAPGAVGAAVFPCTEAGILNAIATGGGPHTFACGGPTTVTTSAEILIGRVGRWRGGRRSRGVAVADGFRLNVGASVRFLAPFPDTLSSNRACGFPAHGSHLGPHAVALDRSRFTSCGRYRPISRRTGIG